MNKGKMGKRQVVETGVAVDTLAHIARARFMGVFVLFFGDFCFTAMLAVRATGKFFVGSYLGLGMATTTPIVLKRK